MRFVFRNFPLAELHAHAVHAAMAAESVAASAGPNAYWAMHDAIFEHQQDADDALDEAHLLRYAAVAGADPAQVEADLASGAFEPRVRADFISGLRSGVNGTPTFFIDGVRFDGDWTDASALRRALVAPAPVPTRSPLSAQIRGSSPSALIRVRPSPSPSANRDTQPGAERPFRHRSLQ